MITRYNKKTVSVMTERGQRWNVSPQLLERAASEPASSSGNVITFPRAK